MKDSFTILLADDDPDDQELIIHAFSEVASTFNLHVVNDGQQVLDFLTTTSDNKLPCLIVLDYNMPELNGAQVLQHLTGHERYKAIPKIILSTSSNPKYIDDCMHKGAHAYRVKPDNFTQLIVLAKEMLEFCSSAA
ncbi:response regulator [Segetibacter aerophilus]|uniref:Response regulator n=1 Tax=Segetibacter aerophilus TaxID=670293 RepID=A0A512BHF6_9BACT|nr:response regulator [Segetibacter aerophilus]GEO11305.1 response regulator [Segetibacter aerophilus]